MPKQTFFNLHEEKRNKLIRAIVEECSKHVFESVSINQIIKKADVSRGSFYQYFEDKLDMYKWLMNDIFQKQNDFIKGSVQEAYSNVFQEIIHLYQLGIQYSLLHQEEALLQKMFMMSNDVTMKQSVFESGQDVLSSYISDLVKRGQVNKDITSSMPVHVITSYIISMGRETFKLFIQKQDMQVYDYFEVTLINAFKGGNYEKNN